MGDKLSVVVIILMLIILAFSYMFVYEDLGIWIGEWAIALGVIYIILKIRKKPKSEDE